MRYGWRLERLPGACSCGASFHTTHALSCPTGGLPSIRHNEIRDVLANILTEVCSDVAVEPEIPSNGGNVIRTDGADSSKRLEIRARGFWGGRLDAAFFDIRVFNPFAASAAASIFFATTVPSPRN